MDNVTHSLIGYALGRAWTTTIAPTRQNRALVACSVLASNAPDLDLLGSGFGATRGLEYLLEHRGFTHTIVFAALIGLLVATGCFFVYGVRRELRRASTARAFGRIAALGCAASFLHIGFDALNDYGVHPFWPLDDRWYYGDSVFIIEPLLVAVLLPLPAWFAWSRVGRGLAWLVALGLVVLVWLPLLLPWQVALLSTLTLVGAGLGQRRLGPRASLGIGLAAALVSVFAVGSQLAEAQVRRALEAAVPAERILDLASTPLPANPSCHRTLALSLDAAQVYRVRVIESSLFGEDGLGAACRQLPSSSSTAPLRPDSLGGGGGGVRFRALFEAPAAELREIAARTCDGAAMLRFVRVPFWMGRGDETVLGDLRYDRDPALEFAERKLDGVCPKAWAPWLPPRAELLEPPTSTSR